ncbi:MAG: type II secretion system F family protein [Roseburia sp.]
MIYKMEKSLKKKLLGIMCVSVILGAAAQFVAESEAVFQNNRLIQTEPGEGSVTAELSYQREGGEPEDCEIQVPERVLTQEEWETRVQAAEEEVVVTFLGENTGTDHVCGNVNLCEKLQDGLFTVEWTFTPDGCIDPSGNLVEENYSDGDVILARAEIRYQDREVCYEFPFLVYKQPLTEEETFTEAVAEYIRQQDLTTGTIELPSELGGEEILWGQKKEYQWALLLLLGLVASVTVVYGERTKKQKLWEQKRREMVRDYPEIVSQLSLFLAAGMSLDQAWNRIWEAYEQKKSTRHGNRRAGYEQIGRMIHEMEDGMPKLQAYERMGERCGLSQYRRLATIVTQNMKKGTAGIGALLEKEAAQAFTDRKNIAQKAGEEAGTKLLFPMMLMLVVVMVILIVPACMSMNL